MRRKHLLTSSFTAGAVEMTLFSETNQKPSRADRGEAIVGFVNSRTGKLYGGFHVLPVYKKR